MNYFLALLVISSDAKLQLKRINVFKLATLGNKRSKILLSLPVLELLSVLLTPNASVDLSSVNICTLALSTHKLAYTIHSWQDFFNSVQYHILLLELNMVIFTFTR